MPNESHDESRDEDGQAPTAEELEEPSTGEGAETRSRRLKDDGQPEPTHEAVGIGVIGGPLADPATTSVRQLALILVSTDPRAPPFRSGHARGVDTTVAVCPQTIRCPTTPLLTTRQAS